MKPTIISILGLVLLSAASARYGVADDKAPKEFYPKDYSNRVGDSQAGADGIVAAPTETPASEIAPEAETTEPAPSAGAEGTPTPTPTKALITPVPGQPYKVNYIGAVLNSLDFAHFEAALNEVVDVVTKYDLAYGKFYTVGDFKSVPKVQTTVFKIISRGGEVLVKGAAPDKYPVRLSPSWIIGTPDGEFLLEATGPLDDNFNSSGQFVDRLAKLEVTPTPDATAPNEVELEN